MWRNLQKILDYCLLKRQCHIAEQIKSRLREVTCPRSALLDGRTFKPQTTVAVGAVCRIEQVFQHQSEAHVTNALGRERVRKIEVRNTVAIERKFLILTIRKILFADVSRAQ